MVIKYVPLIQLRRWLKNHSQCISCQDRHWLSHRGGKNVLNKLFENKNKLKNRYSCKHNKDCIDNSFKSLFFVKILHIFNNFWQFLWNFQRDKFLNVWFACNNLSCNYSLLVFIRNSLIIQYSIKTYFIVQW